MNAAVTEDRHTVFASPIEREQAAAVLSAPSPHLSAAADGDPRDLPPELTRLLTHVLQVMADGGTITIGSMPEQLSTTVAAQQLGISRPTLMKLIRAGELDSHLVGTHHRVKSADVLALKRERLAAQRAAFEELRELSDEFGF